jgi:hypothetical protein
MTNDEQPTIFRAWMLIKDELTDPREVARQMYCFINLDENYSKDAKTFVVRADTVRSTDQEGVEGTSMTLVVPLSAATEAILAEVVNKLVEEFSITDYELAVVNQHVPFPPHEAPGYIAAEEARSPKEGSTGHNPW